MSFAHTIPVTVNTSVGLSNAQAEVMFSVAEAQQVSVRWGANGIEDISLYDRAGKQVHPSYQQMMALAAVINELSTTKVGHEVYELTY